jgi:hypothetical protein
MEGKNKIKKIYTHIMSSHFHDQTSKKNMNIYNLVHDYNHVPMYDDVSAVVEEIYVCLGQIWLNSQISKEKLK